MRYGRAKKRRSIRCPWRITSVLIDRATVAANALELATAKSPSGAVDILLLTPVELAGFAILSYPPRGLEQEKLLFRDGLDLVRSKLLQIERGTKLKL